ncbi:MAG: hypothetical protein ACR2NN_12435, partial [Bryobacteraceae bacterium]
CSVSSPPVRRTMLVENCRVGGRLVPAVGATRCLCRLSGFVPPVGWAVARGASWGRAVGLCRLSGDPVFVPPVG